MRILFVASLHHPQVSAPRAAGGREDLLFPVSQAQAFWVKALRATGHVCDVFWRSKSAYPWSRDRELVMTERLTPGRAVRAIASRFPRLSPDLRMRNRALVARCRDFRPDVVIVVGDNTVVFPETLASIRKTGVTIVYTCGTSPVVFSHPLEREAVASYDLVVANDLYHAVQWRELGAPRVEVLPMSAVDPDAYRSRDLTHEERATYTCDVGFVGTLVPSRLYAERIAALEALRGLDLKIWSVHEVPPSLKAHDRGPLLGEAMIRAIPCARIVVNPHADFMRYGGNLRLFEACGAGAFQITDERPGVEEWFTPGEHLVTYRNPVHLRDLAVSFLAREPERLRIAEAGRRHVLAHHTYAHRMRRLLDLVAECRGGRATSTSDENVPSTPRS